VTPPVGRAGADDPLDVRLDAVRPGAARLRRWPLRRLALGLSPTPSAALLLLLVGLALGASGLGVLSEPVLTALDPALWAALAALGVLVGLELQFSRPYEARLLAAASLESAVGIVLVAAGVAVVYFQSLTPTPTPWLLALMLGICAAPSATATVPDEADDRPDVLPARMGDLDDVLPIVLGVIAIVWTRSGSPAALASLVAQAAAIAVAIAFATWLLVTQTSSESEQRVFIIGALLLLGGAAAHLSLSALFAGFLAGLFWSVVGGAARDHVLRDVRYLQHPLVVLLLVVAGARLKLSLGLAGLAIAYVVLRMAGKLLGGWMAGHVAPELPRDVGLSLSAPGFVGIAIAIDVYQSHGNTEMGATLFAIVIAGSLGAELLSLIVARRSRAV